MNGVDRYVTDSMPTAKEESTASGKPFAKIRPRQKKPTATLTSVSIPVLERKWIDIEAQRSHVQKCYVKKLSLDCYDMMNQSLEESTERSTTTTSLKSAGRRSATTLRSGYLKIGYQNWQKEEDR